MGRLDRPGLARAGWVGLGIGAVVMLGLMPVLYHASPWIVAIYTDDRAVAAVAVPGIVIASWILLVDAVQGILTGALRGAADIWAALAIQAVSFWVISIPLCYLLAHPLGWGVPGLLWGLFAGLLAASLLLIARFQVLSRRDIRPF